MIPDLLIKFNHWVGWRYEVRDGKQTKVPKNSLTGNNAQSNNPKTWTTYDEAVTGKERFKFDGVGFMLDHQKVELVGVDLDHCLADGVLTEQAKNIVDGLDSYTEITPSLEGLRVFILGDLPPNGRKKAHVEMYTDGRFLTVTGNHFVGTPQTIEDRSTEILTIHEMVFGKQKPKPETEKQPTQPVNLADSELLNIARKASNGERFSQLWNGEFNNVYPSQSEADQALTNFLSFYSGRDAERIDRLFRQSGLYREKWDAKHFADGQTYGQRTISNAVESTTETYTPSAGIGLDQLDLSGLEDVGATWADLKDVLGPIKWDWPGWLAQGFQTIVAASSGDGKSNLILYIAKVYLTGCHWPNGAKFKGEPGNVLWCETESAQALNLDRAEKWGLPLHAIVTPLDNPLDNISLDDIKHQQIIETRAKQQDVRLIIVDSLSGGTRKDAKSSSQMMGVGAFLADLAKNTNKPVLTSHHLRKKGMLDRDVITLDRLRDSSAIVQLARVIWAIDAPDIDYPQNKRLSVIKNNLAMAQTPIGFEINDQGLTFGDAPQPPKKETQLDKAVDLLKVWLDAGPVKSTEIEMNAKVENVSMDTMRRAQKRLNVSSAKLSDGWYWTLPGKVTIDL